MALPTEFTGTDGNDNIFGGVGPGSHIVGLGGADDFRVYGGRHTLEGGQGNDVLMSSSGAVLLSGGEGDDSLSIAYADATGGAVLNGGFGDDVYSFFGMAGQPASLAPVIELGANFGRDQVYAVAGQPFVIRFKDGITAADVSLALLDQVSTFYRPGSQTTQDWEIRLNDSGDRIRLSSSVPGFGPLAMNGVVGLQRIEFADGTVWSAEEIFAWLRQPANTAGSASYGSSGNDLLVANDKGVTLNGFAGNDTLVSGAGNDTLVGGDGSNTYRFSIGWGRDTILGGANGASPALSNAIEFGSGIAASSVKAYRNGRDLVLSTLDGGSTIRLVDFAVAYTGEWSGVTSVRFADGTAWSYADLAARFSPPATSGDDLIQGKAGNELIDGGNGNDLIEGYGGTDTLYGGQGNDTISMTGGTAVINGGQGDDLILAQGTVDRFVFDAGFGQDTVSGAAVGDPGTVFDFTALKSTDALLYREEVPGGSPEFPYYDLIVVNRVTGDSARLQYFFGLHPASEGTGAKLKFSDGVVWNRADANLPLRTIVAGTTQTGTAGNDTLTGTAASDTMIGGGGADTFVLDNPVGHDVIDLGGATNAAVQTILVKGPVDPRSLTVTLGIDDGLLLKLNGVSDLLLKGLRNDAAPGMVRVAFDDGTVLTLADLTRLAGLGTAGNDLLQASSRADRFVVGPGRGNDTIAGFAGTFKTVSYSGYTQPDIPDRLVLTTSDVTFSTYIADRGMYNTPESGLLITFNQTGETVRVYRAFNSLSTTFYPNEFFSSPVPIVEFPDGSTLTGLQLGALVDPDRGLATQNQTLQGTSADDRLQGGFGDDVFIGGRGDDTLRLQGFKPGGAYGQETVVFNRGDGRDTIEGFSSLSYTLRLGVGIGASDLEFSGQSVIVRNSADRITGHLPTRIEFADGSVWNQGDIQQAVFRGSYLNDAIRAVPGTEGTTGSLMSGGEGADSLTGDLGSDTLIGGNGNDTLTDYLGGDDVFIGGRGDDLISVAAGHATIRYNLGDGNDAITLQGAGAGTATLEFGAGITAGDVIVFEPPGNYGALYLKFRNDPASTLRLTSPDRLAGLTLKFSDGSTLSGAALAAAAAGNLYVSDYGSITGGQGNDWLEFYGSGSSTDIRTATGGAGSDTLYGSESNERLDGGAGADLMAGRDGDDSYVVDQVGDRIVERENEGRDKVESSIGWTLGDHLEDLDLTRAGTAAVNGMGNGLNNRLVGGAGANLLLGGAGNDTLDGAGGKDTLEGGVGSDVYEFGRGDGQDVVRADGSDVIAFKAGIASTDVTVGRLGTTGADTVVLTIKGATDTITLERFSQTTGLSLRFADGSTLSSADLIAQSTREAPLTLNGTSRADTLTGKTGDDKLSGLGGNDTLIGGLGRDTLDGGAGNDVMRGGGGDDLYYVDSASDQVIELANEGYDTVISKVSHTLAAHVEELDLSTASIFTAVNGTGNALNNRITGSAIGNTLTGGLGNDTLIGGKGSDTYVFTRGDGQDLIVENDSTWLNNDVLKFNGVSSSQLWFSRNGNSLDISVIGTTDKVTVQDWYSGNATHVEKITAVGNNKNLTHTKVDALVSAMAAFSPPAQGQTTLPADMQASLNTVLASSWS